MSAVAKAAKDLGKFIWSQLKYPTIKCMYSLKCTLVESVQQMAYIMSALRIWAKGGVSAQ